MDLTAIYSLPTLATVEPCDRHEKEKEIYSKVLFVTWHHLAL